jgi:hypothetical protein
VRARPLSIAAFLVAVFSASVQAAPLEIQWTLSTSDCSLSTTPAPVVAMEIFVDTETIPASDLSCPADGDPIDVPPAGGDIVQVVTPPPGDNTVTIDVPAGVTYFLRARVQSSDGNWSNLSLERVKLVPFPTPGSPTITIIQL